MSKKDKKGKKGSTSDSSEKTSKHAKDSSGGKMCSINKFFCCCLLFGVPLQIKLFKYLKLVDGLLLLS